MTKMKKAEFGYDEISGRESEEPSGKSRDENKQLTVVSVLFGDGREYAYLNDKFDLKTGDNVYVDGKLSGQLGVVTEVNDKFKVSLKHYKYVIKKADFDIHGTFKPVGNFYLTADGETVPYDRLLSLLPPFDEEEEFICGKGYTIDLKKLDEYIESDFDKAERAVSAAKDGRLKFITVEDGIGHAAFEGRETHIIDFKLNGDTMSEVYCDCIHADFCAHILSVAIAVKELMDKTKDDENFTVLNKNLFSRIEQQTDSYIRI